MTPMKKAAPEDKAREVALEAATREAAEAVNDKPVTESHEDAVAADLAGDVAQECVNLIKRTVPDVGAAVIGILAGDGRVVVKIAGDHKQITNLLNITATQHRRSQLAAEYDTLTKALEKYGLK
jgi:hypothetical protein